MRTLSILLVIVLLGGCGAPSWVLRAEELSNKGQCSAAEQTVLQGAPNAEQQALTLGAVYAECYRDRQKAIGYLTVAARFGNPTAQKLLVQFGAPLPLADLKKGSTLCVFGSGMVLCDEK